MKKENQPNIAVVLYLLYKAVLKYLTDNGL